MSEYYSFDDDLKESNKEKFTKQFDRFYESLEGYERHTRYTKDEKAQREYGTDVVLKLNSKDKKILIDEKLGFNPAFVGSVACEVNHEGVEGICNDKKWGGWWYSSHSDWIVYGWVRDRNDLFIDYFLLNSKVKEWFEVHKKNYNFRRTARPTKKGSNAWFTWFYGIPIDDLKHVSELSGHQTKLGVLWK